MSQSDDVRVIQEHDGRWAARSNALPTSVGYGRTETEARADLERVRLASMATDDDGAHDYEDWAESPATSKPEPFLGTKTRASPWRAALR